MTAQEIEKMEALLRELLRTESIPMEKRYLLSPQAKIRLVIASFFQDSLASHWHGSASDVCLDLETLAVEARNLVQKIERDLSIQNSLG